MSAQPPSLGELAYLAYWRRWPALPLSWHRLAKREQAAWEAAAQAAIAASRTRPPETPRNGHRVR